MEEEDNKERGESEKEEERGWREGESGGGYIKREREGGRNRDREIETYLVDNQQALPPVTDKKELTVFCNAINNFKYRKSETNADMTKCLGSAW